MSNRPLLFGPSSCILGGVSRWRQRDAFSPSHPTLLAGMTTRFGEYIEKGLNCGGIEVTQLV
jgi:hypothetical protein